MPPPFTAEEYDTRLNKVRKALVTENLDALVIGDPANMNWLTGFDAWSMYVQKLCSLLMITHQYGWAEKWTLVRYH